MVRISDILKPQGQVPEPQPGKDKKEKTTPLSSQDTTAEAISVDSQGRKETSKFKSGPQMQLTSEESEKVFNQALAVIRRILDKVTALQDISIDLPEVREVVNNIVERVVLGDQNLILLTNNHREDSYIYAHSVNVCILSVTVGLVTGYNKSKLNELGLGAFLHDLGMMEIIDIAQEPRILNEDEYTRIKKHPIYGGNIVSKIKDIEKGVIYIVKQEHEKLNGSGYPEGIKGERIHEYARIMGAVDVYEALTHPRPYRQAMPSHEAIRELLAMNSDNLFEMQFIKALLNRIGLYPIGSWVELNTGEIAKVTSTNEDFPIRPKVDIIFNLNKERLSRIKSIDLAKYANVYIKRDINLREFNLE